MTQGRGCGAVAVCFNSGKWCVIRVMCDVCLHARARARACAVCGTLQTAPVILIVGGGCMFSAWYLYYLAMKPDVV